MKKFLFVALMYANAAFGSACPDLYRDSTPLVVPNTVELCNSFFVSIFNPREHRVVAVVERLRHGSAIGAAERKNDFHSDPRVGKVPSPSQYVGTGYDKGHMAPAGDAIDAATMDETFLMTNMTPQKPTLNRNSWRLLEAATRKSAATSKSDVYVVTIAVYDRKNLMGSIPIPTGYWKIVTADGSTKYFYADNVDNARVVRKNAVAIQTLLK